MMLPDGDCAETVPAGTGPGPRTGRKLHDCISFLRFLLRCEPRRMQHVQIARSRAVGNAFVRPPQNRSGNTQEFDRSQRRGNPAASRPSKSAPATCAGTRARGVGGNARCRTRGMRAGVARPRAHFRQFAGARASRSAAASYVVQVAGTSSPSPSACRRLAATRPAKAWPARVEHGQSRPERIACGGVALPGRCRGTAGSRGAREMAIERQPRREHQARRAKRPRARLPRAGCAWRRRCLRAATARCPARLQQAHPRAQVSGSIL
jgi:hypothetical protein